MKPNEIECTKETLEFIRNNEWITSRISEREKRVLRQYYIDGHSLLAIGAAEGGVTAECIRQIRNKAVRKLNRYIFIKQLRKENATKKGSCISINEMSLSSRAYNRLSWNGVETVNDILAMFPDTEHLLRIRAMGKKTALEIINALDALGIKHNYDTSCLIAKKDKVIEPTGKTTLKWSYNLEFKPGSKVSAEDIKIDFSKWLSNQIEEAKSLGQIF